MVTGSKTVTSAIMSGRRMPRSIRPTRPAGRDVILRIASSSVRRRSSRTYFPQDARERAPAPRMRFRVGQRAVLGHRRRVGADRHLWVFQCQPDIAFSHDGNDDRALAVIGYQQVHHAVARILAHEPADLRKRLALVLLKIRAE